MLTNMKKNLTIFSLLSLFLSTTISLAADLPPPTVIDESKLMQWMQSIGNYMFGAGMVLGIIVIVYSGIRWMVSAGDSKGAGEAQQILKSGIYGVAVILAVGLIIKTVESLVTGSFFK